MITKLPSEIDMAISKFSTLLRERKSMIFRGITGELEVWTGLMDYLRVGQEMEPLLLGI